MKRFLSGSVFTVFISLISILVISAQGTCSALIEEALSQMDDNCEGLVWNNACYGFNLVQAAFLNDVPDDFFTRPADVAAITELETLATAGLDATSGTWGVAVMSIQANLPNTLPGQNVTFVLMGDTEVENAVAPADTFIPADGLAATITTPQGANVRSGPGLNFNVVGGIAPDTIIQVDGQSADGEWLRVAHNNRPGWVNRIGFADDAAFAALPVLSPELRTTMQAFYLRTGIGQSNCEGIPEDILLVNGPNGIDIELEVNGANVVIGSTIGLRIVEIDGQLFLELIVFSGHAEVDGIRVPAGYSTFMCLSEPDDRGLDSEANDRIVTCPPSTPQPVQNFGGTWCHLESIPSSLLNYPIEILCPGETPPPPPANNTPDTATESELAGVDCSSFALVGPLDGITPRPTVFTWTEAPGATHYEIVFYDFTGKVAGGFVTENTSIELNVGTIPTGSELAWEVRAFQGEAYACVTFRTAKITRLIDPFGEPPPSEDFTVYLRSCSVDEGGTFRGELRWNNLPDGATITARMGDPFSSSAPESSSSSSGRFNLSFSGNEGAVRVHGSTSVGDNFSFGCGGPSL
jgi:Bacterial SH3 domain